MVAVISCTKKQVPVLSTAAATNITAITATCGGTIIDEGSSTVVSLGVCWSTETGPTINDYKTSEMAGASEFSSSLKGLAGGTTYHVRSYATNDAGIGYGNEISFTTLR
jgi:hypothetical protein